MTPEETTQPTPEVTTQPTPEVETLSTEEGKIESEDEGEMLEPENQNKYAINAMLFKLFNFIRVQGKNGQTNAAYDGGKLIFRGFSMTVGANNTFILYKFGENEQVIGDPESELNYDFINEFLQNELMM